MGYQEIFDGVRDALQRHRDDNVRDEFAMAALRGGISGIEYPETMKTEKLAKIIAETAYEIADAMMEAR